VKRLRTTWERIRGTRGLGRDLAVVAGLVVLASAVGGFILNHQRISFPWHERVAFRADFEEAPGVAAGQGQEVRIAGVPVGEITAADVSRQGRARLTLSLEPRYRDVYANARAWLRPKSALNEMYVLLDPGSKSAARLKPGAVIPQAQTARPIQMDEVMAHLDDKTREAGGIALAEADAALARPESLPPALRATDAVLLSMRPLMEALDTRRERIARLTTALADIATAAGADDVRLARVLDSARETLDALADRDADLEATLAQLPALGDEVRRVSAATTALTGELDPMLDGLRAASDRLPGALGGLSGVLDRLDRTVELARPVVDGARPLAADLRPLAASSRAALADTVAWTGRIDPMTANLVEHLPDVRDFVYRGNSVFHLDDAHGPILRGLVVQGLETLTDALVVPGAP
jgi:phospholipid/cholesterol/gamma-HCH transport system substrate-binding protein